MSVEVKAPVFPESISDGVIVSWYKKAGETIRRDEPLVDIETDKVVLEVPASVSGVLSKIIEDEGATVVSSQLLAVIEEMAVDEKATSTKVEEKNRGGNGGASSFVTPSAMKLIQENKLDVNNISSSGKGGRILKEDVLQYMEQEKDETSADSSSSVQSPVVEKEIQKVAPTTSAAGGRAEKRVPMTRLRARIAERLLDAQHNAAILTTFNEVNMQAIIELRTRYKDDFLKENKVKLGFMSFFIKASIEALKKFPSVNASIDGNDIVYHGYFDIGVAISAPKGLVVPIIRDVERMSLAGIETAIVEFAEKAKANKLSIDELAGGTFSITNGGVFGSMLSTPILNPPQSAILGMHNIQQRAVVEDGEVVARPVMFLALSYDHRIIDGREAVQFLVSIKDSLEDPARMLLGV